jgi:DNA helicase-2/ATP-dependent DNA helicase PcrA
MSVARPPATLLERLILNQAQKDAVVYDGGPQLVFAGAGTGKTRVLTAKIAWLIEVKGIAPGAILAATFTNKAAREMKDRVENLTGLSCAGLWIGTFHSLCARILRREGRAIGFDASFSIFDSDDQTSVMKKVLRELAVDERAMTPAAALSLASRWKNECIAPADALARSTGFRDQQAARVYDAYQKALRAQDAMDFDDLLSNAVLLLRTSADTLERYRRSFHYVLVDEYQDTNRAQFFLVKLLAGDSGRVFAVGDDDQSIYGWRGAQVENILSFDSEFAGTRVFRLEENYRSTTPILDFANAAVEPNTRRAAKKLWTGRGAGDAVCVTRYADDRRESEAVCRAIQRQTSGGAKACDILILFRTNAQSRSLEDALRRSSIAYTLVGGLSFYQRKEIKDCLAYLRLLVNPRDNVSFERIMNVPARGLGAKAHETLVALARERGQPALDCIFDAGTPAEVRDHKGIVELRGIFTELRGLAAGGETPHEVLNRMLTLSGYVTMLESEETEEAEGRVENINELVNAMTLWSEEHDGGTLLQFLEEVALISDIDTLTAAEDRVSLMTLHSAKGLEARHVFITGVEDGILPSRQNLEEEDRVQEERRLFYVGITRARDTLNCSYTNQRWRFGSVVPMQPSRFLDAIAPGLYRFVDDSQRFDAPAPPRGHAAAAAARPEHARREIRFDDSYSQETVEFRMGQHVRHKVYGIGRVLSVSGFSDDLRLTVLFNDGSRRKMIAKFAGLEMV